MSKKNVHNNSDTDVILPLTDPQSNLESREELIRGLASNIQNVKRDLSRKKGSSSRIARRNGAISYNSVVKSVDTLETWIETAYQFLKRTKNPEIRHSYASEWLMDNLYQVTRTIRLIREDLTAGFYTELPKIDGGPRMGMRESLSLLQTPWHIRICSLKPLRSKRYSLTCNQKCN